MIFRSLLCWLLFLSISFYVNGQCSPGCDTTFSSNATITATTDGQIICITGGTSFSFNANSKKNVTIKVTSDNVAFSSFASGDSTQLFSCGLNTDVQNLSINSADQFFYNIYSTGARLSSVGGFNGIANFHVGPSASLDVIPSLSPSQKIYFTLDAYSTVNAASVTSNAGGNITIGKDATFNSSGTVYLQNDGELFNTGNMNVAGNMTVQGGANAMNNYCGKGNITVGGDLVVNNGTMQNGGIIKAASITINSGGGPIYMKPASMIEVGKLISLSQNNAFRGDSIPAGESALFKVTGSESAWNQPLSNSSKIQYCGPIDSVSGAPNPSKLGSATYIGFDTSCAPSGTMKSCDFPCAVKPSAGADGTTCTNPGSIDLTDASGTQEWYAASGNPASASITQYTGVVSGMTAAGTYDFVLWDTTGSHIAKCLDTVAVVVNKGPSASLTVTGGVVCNTQSNASVVIKNAEPGVTYSVLLAGSVIGSATNTGSSPADLTISNIPTSSLSDGLNIVSVKADIAYCSSVTLTDTAAITKNPSPSASLTVDGSIVCSNTTNALITIRNAEPGVTYTAYLGSTVVDSKENTGSAAADLVLSNIATSGLSTGVNVISVKAAIQGCATVTLTDTAGIKKVSDPSDTLTLDGGIVCSNQTNATLTVHNAEPGVTYTAFLGSTTVGNATNSGSSVADLSVTIPVSSLNSGDNVISAKADINGCATVVLSDTALIKKVPDPFAGLNVTGDTVCSTIANISVTVLSAEPGVTYTAFLGAAQVGSAMNTGSAAADLVISIPTASLSDGNNTISFKADINGCTTVSLTKTTNVRKVPDPSASLTVNGGIVCSDQASATITIVNAEPDVTYTAFLGADSLGTATNGGSTQNLTVSIPVSGLSTGLNAITVKAGLSVCATVDLTDTAGVDKVPQPSSSLTVNGNIVCSDQASTTITIVNAEPNVTYTAMLGATALGNAVNTGSSAADLTVSIPTASLSDGINVINVKADINGCNTVDLTDTAGVNKVPKPSGSLTITGSTVCSNIDSTTITIQSADPDVTYSAWLGGTQIGSATNNVSTPTTITVAIPTASLANGLNVISVKADINGCGTVDLTDTAGVIKVPDPSPALTVDGGIVCSNQPNTTITIKSAEANVTYSAYEGPTKLGSSTASSAGDLNITLPTSQLSTGMNVINVTADISVCATVALTDTAGITKVPDPVNNLTVTGGTVCSNQDTTTVVISGAEPGVTYTAYMNSTDLGTATNNTGSASSLVVKVPVTSLGNGMNVIHVKADIVGCSTVNLTDTAGVNVVPDPGSNLTITGGIVCSNKSDTKITILNSDPNVTYTAYLGATPLSTATNNSGSAANLDVTIPVSKLTTGLNIITATASIPGCVVVNMTDTAGINEVPQPASGLTVNGNILCSSDANSTSIEIVNANANVTYSVYNGTTQIATSSQGASSGNLTVSFPTSSLNNGDNIISVKADITGCSTVDISDTADVILDPAMTGGTISASQSTICSGTSPSLLNATAPTGGLSPYTFTWQYSADGSTWTDISGSNTQGPLSTAPSISANTYYRRFVRSKVCTAISSTDTITVTGKMVGGSIAATQSNVCKGLVPGEIQSTAPANGGTGSNLTYQWQSSLDGSTWTDIASATGLNYQPGAQNVDMFFRRRATNGTGNCDTTYAGPVQITLYQTLNPGSIQSGDTTVCDGSTVRVRSIAAASNGAPAYTYTWQQSLSPFTNWTDIASSDSLNITLTNVNQDTRVRRIVINQCSTDTTAQTYEVDVLPNLVTGISFTSVPSTICNVNQVSIEVSTSNAGSGRTIDWYYNGTQFLLPAGSPDSVYTDKGIWKNGDKVKVIVHADPSKLCTTPSDSAEVTLNVNTVVSSNSLTSGNQVACAVSDLQTITGSAAQGTLGTPPYIWQISSDSLKWSDISGANAQDYKPQITSGIAYYRRIAVSAGTCLNDTSTTSVKVELDGTVDPGTITADPADICQGVLPTFTVTSPSGGLKPYSYQWEKSANDTLWVSIDGATDSTYNSPGLTTSTYFRRRVITSAKVCDYSSPSVFVKVDKLVVNGSNTISGDQQICFGQKASLISGSVPGGGLPNPTYQWIYSKDSLTWNPVTDSTGKDIHPGALSATTYYRRVVTSTGACTNDTSKGVVKVFVDPTLTAGTITQPSAICSGSVITLNALPPTGGTPAAYTYQWQESSDSLSWNDLSGDTAAQLPAQTLDLTHFYRRIVKSEVCVDTTPVQKVLVDQPVVSTSNTISGNASLCFGQAAPLIKGSVPSGSAYAPTYEWISSTDSTSWSVIPDSVREDYNPGVLAQTTFFRRVITSTGACTNDTSKGVVKVFVDPTVHAGTIPVVPAVCQGTTISVTAPDATGGTPPYSYEWQSSTDSTTWTGIPGENSKDLSPKLFVSTLYFRRIVLSKECVDTTAAMSVKVNNPVNDSTNNVSGNSSICYGSSAPQITGTVPTGGLAPVTYQWLVSTDSVNYTSMPGETGKDLNPGVIDSSRWYKRVVTSTGACNADTSSSRYKVYVDPSVQAGVVGDNQQFCDQPVLYLHNIDSASGGTFIVYTWQVNTDLNTGTWQDIANSNSLNLQQTKDALPKSLNLYFRRIASSVSCSDVSNIVSVVPCLKPKLVNISGGNLCMAQPLSGAIVLPPDSSKNGGTLIAMSVPAQAPLHGTVSIDSIKNLYTYMPAAGFKGRDSLAFTVCDTSAFHQCAIKKLYVTVLDTNSAPVVLNDYFWNYRNTTISGNVLTNDSDVDGDTLYAHEDVLVKPVNGVLSIRSDGSFDYNPYNNYTGPDSAVVIVCDTSSEIRCDQNYCKQDTIRLEVKPNKIFVSEGFSPNNDGNNDTYTITTEAPSTISVTFYNRWGNVVYENNDYKNDWNGVANRGLVIGKGLPDGTYYLYYNINDGEFDGFKYITLNR